MGFLNDLLRGSKVAPLSTEQLAALERAARQAPSGATGLTRTLLALSLLTLVGVGLVALLVGNSAAAGDTVKAVITALTASLATVLGFYFGAKTVTDTQHGAPTTPTTPTPVKETPGAPTPGLGAPTGVTAERGPGPGSVVVTFVEPMDPSGTPITYTVTSEPQGHSGTGEHSPITVSGLGSGTAYRFRVHAAAAGGRQAVSDPSAEVIAE